MTVKEIALAVNKKERAVHNWVKKTSEKNAQVGEKSAEAKETKKAASYNLDETCKIIEIGLGKNTADLFRMSSNNNIKEHTQNDQAIINLMRPVKL